MRKHSATVRGGGSSLFSLIGHEVSKHWRGLATIGITALGGIGGGACIVMTSRLGTLGCLAATGALTSMANKAVSGDRITVKGLVTAGAEGALSGEITYACLSACGGLVGAAAVNMAVSGALAVADNVQSTDGPPSPGGIMNSLEGALLGSEPYPADQWIKRF